MPMYNQLLCPCSQIMILLLSMYLSVFSKVTNLRPLFFASSVGTKWAQ